MLITALRFCFCRLSCSGSTQHFCRGLIPNDDRLWGCLQRLQAALPPRRLPILGQQCNCSCHSFSPSRLAAQVPVLRDSRPLQRECMRLNCRCQAGRVYIYKKKWTINKELKSSFGNFEVGGRALQHYFLPSVGRPFAARPSADGAKA